MKIIKNLRADNLRKLQHHPALSTTSQQLAKLKVAFSEDSKLLTGYVNRLINTKRIHPTHLPTQASGRWSTFVTNWPRHCINQSCPHEEHEWTDNCWSLRDIIDVDDDEVLITWDHDNIEGRIHDLITNDQAALKAHEEGYDLHTITCCNIFNYSLPPNLKNPHSFCECSVVQKEAQQQSSSLTAIPPCDHCQWRTTYRWQGKDTKQRVLAKNFNHGSKYTKSKKFVHKIQGIEQYGISYADLEQLAERYIESKGAAWRRKLAIMDKIRRDRVARTLYGFRRVFFDSSEHTAREGFSHMISGTVSDYNNITLDLIERNFGDAVHLLHNAHDGNKIAVKRDIVSEHGFSDKLSSLIQRSVEYEGRSITLTAGIRIYG